ncbi:hypothetical protein LJC25_04365 [Bacteroidales bacterium OttesenSCG-928-K03]|nr:hypothetical protein [Odoribacter sp. OttesenSCG-928-L07]MDL2239416.1 hypothetical protein [Bacteroidales bacterium OttesenSCG-928-L14]MDL2240993.1 hypothetical protein [Bacteroidales bacterium OttesenSCG-928-K22]MDL2242944.1 hypothetical protein [Bacteroidales bacterium OttesenSCG-928-K03]
MNKNSDLFERMLEIIRYYKIKNVSEFSKKYLGYDSPEKINRLKKEGKYPSYEVLADIANKFEEIDIHWLITGKGNMLKNPTKSGNIAADQLEKYMDMTFQEIEFLREHVINLQQENTDLIIIIKSQVKSLSNNT